MTTKTKSFRLEESLISEIDELCEKQGCNRNDWVKQALANQLELEVSSENDEEARPTKGCIAKVSYDGRRTWHDVAEIENPKILNS